MQPQDALARMRLAAMQLYMRDAERDVVEVNRDLAAATRATKLSWAKGISISNPYTRTPHCRAQTPSPSFRN